MDYLPRVVDAELAGMLAGLPAVAIEGPKGVGKTAAAGRLAASTIALDDPDQRALLSADRNRISRMSRPLLIDEWQRHPPVWDAVRRAVDQDPSPGQFLLTGSASPADTSIHSGAGRIVRVRMRPLTLAERQLVEPTVRLADLLSGEAGDISGESPLELADYAREITGSGFPGIRPLTDPHRTDTIDGYLTHIVEHDFAELGHPVRRPATLRAWLSAYAASTSTASSYDTILRAATPGDDAAPAKTTALAYREILSRMWLLDPVPGWVPTRNRLSRLGQAPKHHLVDPALAARLLGVTDDALVYQSVGDFPAMREGPLLGTLFESLATLSVRVHAAPARARVHHLRTHRGEHEVDLVLVRPDGRVLALEVKLSGNVDDTDVRHLHWLRTQIGPDLIDAAVLTTGRTAYRRADGVAVIPLALLG